MIDLFRWQHSKIVKLTLPDKYKEYTPSLRFVFVMLSVWLGSTTNSHNCHVQDIRVFKRSHWVRAVMAKSGLTKEWSTAVDLQMFKHAKTDKRFSKLKWSLISRCESGNRWFVTVVRFWLQSKWKVEIVSSDCKKECCLIAPHTHTHTHSPESCYKCLLI